MTLNLDNSFALFLASCVDIIRAWIFAKIILFANPVAATMLSTIVATLHATEELSLLGFIKPEKMKTWEYFICERRCIT